MVTILLSLVWIVPVLLGTGFLAEKIFGKGISGISGTLLSGIFLVTVLWVIIAFFRPLDIYTEIITSAFGFIAFFLKINNLSFNSRKKTAGIFILFLALALFGASCSPFILDHFGYYVPTLEWLQHYGFVKGIANLDLTLAQASFWHVFSAGFSNFADPYLRVNAVAVLVYLFYIFERRSWLHLLFLPLFCFFLQSPSPDLPAMVFSLICLNEVFLRNSAGGWLFAFAVFVCAIKPTMLWLPVSVGLYNVFILKKGWRSAFGGSFILALFFAKNILLFGYPVFPVQIADFHLPWKPNNDFLKQSAEFALMKTYDMQYSFAEIRRFETLDYVTKWLFLPGIKGAVNILFALTLVFFTVFAFVKRSKMIWIFYIGILLKSVLVLGFSAQYRFFLDVFLAVFFIVFYRKISAKTAVSVSLLLSFLVLMLLSSPVILKQRIPSFAVGNYMQGFTKQQVLTPGHYELNRFETLKVGDLTFNITKDYPYSFDTPPPALSPYNLEQNYKFGIFPRLAGKSVKDGFVWKKLNQKERAQLSAILKTLQKEQRR